jgi:hypothetical protein
MALRMRSKPPAYEVRCPRCDVSFPPQTRTCIHCGGPTGQPSFFSSDEVEVQVAASSQRSADYGTSGPTTADAYGSLRHDTPIEPGTESPFSLGESLGGVFEDDRTNERELETGAPPRSILGSLVQALGGIIWVLLLIGFSLARSCSD